MPEIIGDRIPRFDAALQVSGEQVYGDDLYRENMLYGKVLRSRQVHARILKINTAAAEGLPGVISILTAKDFANNVWGFTHKDQPVLCDTTIRCFGDPVAAVAADSPQVAEQALKLIQVEYEPLPPVFDPIEALKPDGTKIHPNGNLAATMKIRHGNLEEGWQQSVVVLEEEYRTSRVQPCYIEPHSALAEVDANGNLTIYTPTQRIYRLRQDTSFVLGLPEERVSIVSPAVGGGFGAKTEIALEPFAGLFALKTGRPVKMLFTRTEEFTSAPVRHPLVARYKSGVDRNGIVVARQIQLIFNTGAYVSQGVSVMAKASINCVGPYIAPNAWVDSYLVYTNTNTASAMRGFGVPQIAFAYESHMDSLAHAIVMDPVTFRRLNFLKHGSELITGQILKESRIEETMDIALQRTQSRQTQEGSLR